MKSRWRENEREREGERVRVSVSVCVCVTERICEFENGCRRVHDSERVKARV